MSRKNSKKIRKPMPSPTVAHKSWAERAFATYTNKQVNEAIEQWHADPADDGWDWAGPHERDQRLWEIK